MNRHFRNISIAIASGAVLAVAGLASAQVPDDVYWITDKNEPESTGHLDIDGEFYEVYTSTLCEAFGEGDTGAEVVVESDHPDSVKLKKNKGAVEQSQKDNRPTITLYTVLGGEDVENTLTCDKAEIDGDVKTKKSPVSGSFSASAKNCICNSGAGAGDDNCENFQSQLEKLGSACDGLKSLKGDVSVENGIKKIKVKIKGDELLES
jgi:hypothetical protein